MQRIVFECRRVVLHRGSLLRTSDTMVELNRRASRVYGIELGPGLLRTGREGKERPSVVMMS